MNLDGKILYIQSNSYIETVLWVTEMHRFVRINVVTHKADWSQGTFAKCQSYIHASVLPTHFISSLENVLTFDTITQTSAQAETKMSITIIHKNYLVDVQKLSH